MSNVYFRGCQVGNIKFSPEQWERLMDYVWDSRAAEILQGTKEAVVKEIIETTWDRGTRRHRRFDVDTIGVNFNTELGRIIRQIIEICPSDDHKDAIRRSTRLFNPISRNETQYINGTMEFAEVEASDVQLVAIGLHAGIKMGNLSKRFRGDTTMASRCTRIAEIHQLAYKAVAGLPAGLAIGQEDCAPLPISANLPSNRWPTLEPVVVRLTNLNAA